MAHRCATTLMTYAPQMPESGACSLRCSVPTYSKAKSLFAQWERQVIDTTQSIEMFTTMGPKQSIFLEKCVAFVWEWRIITEVPSPANVADTAEFF